MPDSVDRHSAPTARFARFAPGALVALAGVLSFWIGQGTFGAFPHSADEAVALYQARTLLEGRVVNPPLPDARLALPHIIVEPRATYGKYPPGWPAVLAAGELIGLPFAVNPLLAMAILAVALGLVRRLVDAPTALVAVAILGTSPLFLLNAAMPYAHVLTALVLLLGAGFLGHYALAPGAGSLVGLAACLGVAILTRPFDALLAALAMGPFLLVPAMRDPRRFALHAAPAFAVGALAIALYAAWNVATTGDATTPGHLRYAAIDTPSWAALRYPGTMVRRMLEWGFFGLPVLGVPLAALALRARFGLEMRARAALGLALAVVAVAWIGYATYSIEAPPRPGPRYLFVAHVFACLAVATVAVRALRRPWLGPVVVAIAAGQLFISVLSAREIGASLRAVHGLLRAADVAVRAVEPTPVLVTVAGPAGSIPPHDLLRNPPGLEGPLVFAGQGGDTTRPEVWEQPSFREYLPYYWDGIGGVPLLWSPQPDAEVKQLALLGESVARVRESGPGWIATFGESNCAPLPMLTPMWQSTFPPDRISDVQRPWEPGFGPCPGFALLRHVAEVGLPSDLPRRLGIQAHFRSFLNVEASALLAFELRGDERAVLRIGGATLAESHRGPSDTAVVRLARGSHPISVSHFTRRWPPSLELRMRALGDEPFTLTTSVPAGSQFRPRLADSALRAATVAPR